MCFLLIVYLDFLEMKKYISSFLIAFYLITGASIHASMKKEELEEEINREKFVALLKRVNHLSEEPESEKKPDFKVTKELQAAEKKIFSYYLYRSLKSCDKKEHRKLQSSMYVHLSKIFDYYLNYQRVKEGFTNEILHHSLFEWNLHFGLLEEVWDGFFKEFKRFDDLKKEFYSAVLKGGYRDFSEDYVQGYLALLLNQGATTLTDEDCKRIFNIYELSSNNRGILRFLKEGSEEYPELDFFKRKEILKKSAFAAHKADRFEDVIFSFGKALKAGHTLTFTDGVFLGNAYQRLGQTKNAAQSYISYFLLPEDKQEGCGYLSSFRDKFYEKTSKKELLFSMLDTLLKVRDPKLRLQIIEQYCDIEVSSEFSLDSEEEKALIKRKLELLKKMTVDPEESRKLAREYAEKEDYEKAISVYKTQKSRRRRDNLKKTYFELSRADHRFLADCCLQLNKLKKAARHYYALKQYQDVIDLYEKEMSKKPSFGDTLKDRVLLANCYFKKGKNLKAAENYLRLLEIMDKEPGEDFKILKLDADVVGIFHKFYNISQYLSNESVLFMLEAFSSVQDPGLVEKINACQETIEMALSEYLRKKFPNLSEKKRGEIFRGLYYTAQTKNTKVRQKGRRGNRGLKNKRNRRGNQIQKKQLVQKEKKQFRADKLRAFFRKAFAAEKLKNIEEIQKEAAKVNLMTLSGMVKRYNLEETKTLKKIKNFQMEIRELSEKTKALIPDQRTNISKEVVLEVRENYEALEMKIAELNALKKDINDRIVQVIQARHNAMKTKSLPENSEFTCVVPKNENFKKETMDKIRVKEERSDEKLIRKEQKKVKKKRLFRYEEEVEKVESVSTSSLSSEEEEEEPLGISSFRKNAAGKEARDVFVNKGDIPQSKYSGPKAYKLLTYLNETSELDAEFKEKIGGGSNLEKLKGDREGQWSLRINQKYRICFEWNKTEGACNVEIVDYHKG